MRLATLDSRVLSLRFWSWIARDNAESDAVVEAWVSSRADSLLSMSVQEVVSEASWNSWEITSVVEAEGSTVMFENPRSPETWKPVTPISWLKLDQLSASYLGALNLYEIWVGLDE